MVSSLLEWLDFSVGTAALLVGLLLLATVVQSYRAGLGTGVGLHPGGRHLLYVGAVLLTLPVAQSFVVDASGIRFERIVHDKSKVELDFASALATIKELQQKLDKALGTDSQIPPQASAPSCPEDTEAKSNIQWVIQLDGGARNTYAAARSQGLSRFDAVLAAQAHNANSQATIQRFGAVCTDAYIQALGG